jgi:hypothetical protein
MVTSTRRIADPAPIANVIGLGACIRREEMSSAKGRMSEQQCGLAGWRMNEWLLRVAEVLSVQTRCYFARTKMLDGM